MGRDGNNASSGGEGGNVTRRLSEIGKVAMSALVSDAAVGGKKVSGVARDSVDDWAVEHVLPGSAREMARVATFLYESLRLSRSVPAAHVVSAAAFLQTLNTALKSALPTEMNDKQVLGPQRGAAPTGGAVAAFRDALFAEIIS